MSDAPLTLHDISAICDAFSTVLNGVFHERIEYPTISPAAAAHVATQENAALPNAEEAPVESEKSEQPEPAQPEGGEEA